MFLAMSSGMGDTDGHNSQTAELVLKAKDCLGGLCYLRHQHEYRLQVNPDLRFGFTGLQGGHRDRDRLGGI